MRREIIASFSTSNPNTLERAPDLSHKIWVQILLPVIFTLRWRAWLNCPRKIKKIFKSCFQILTLMLWRRKIMRQNLYKKKKISELELSQGSNQIEVSFGKQDILSSRKTKANCQQSSTRMFYILFNFHSNLVILGLYLIGKKIEIQRE